MSLRDDFFNSMPPEAREAYDALSPEDQAQVDALIDNLEAVRALMPEPGDLIKPGIKAYVNRIAYPEVYEQLSDEAARHNAKDPSERCAAEASRFVDIALDAGYTLTDILTVQQETMLAARNSLPEISDVLKKLAEADDSLLKPLLNLNWMLQALIGNLINSGSMMISALVKYSVAAGEPDPTQTEHLSGKALNGRAPDPEFPEVDDDGRPTGDVSREQESVEPVPPPSLSFGF